MKFCTVFDLTLTKDCRCVDGLKEAPNFRCRLKHIPAIKETHTESSHRRWSGIWIHQRYAAVNILEITDWQSRQLPGNIASDMDFWKEHSELSRNFKSALPHENILFPGDSTLSGMHTNLFVSVWDTHLNRQCSRYYELLGWHCESQHNERRSDFCSETSRSWYTSKL